MTQSIHKSYLRITALVIGAFGPVFFLGTMPATAEPASWTLDFLSFPVDGRQNFQAPTTRFLSALTGGFLFGWGVCVWCLQQYVFDKAPKEVRKSVIAGIIAWFVLDSTGSILSGNASNAFFNAAVLIIALGPLVIPANDVN